MSLRSCAMALAALALAGCATTHDGYYESYPAYYEGPYYDPYYGSGYGYHSHFYDFDDDHDRYFRPDRDVICDRARDVCYDRYGLSYTETKEHFGERDANRAYKKYGDSVFLFSPQEGVTCNRRTETCSRPQWTKRIYGDAPSQPKRLEPRNLRPDREDEERVADKRRPPVLRDRHDDDDDGALIRWPPARRQAEDGMATKRLLPTLNQRLRDDDGDAMRRPSARVERDDAKKFRLPRSIGTDKPERVSKGACPPQGCAD